MSKPKKGLVWVKVTRDRVTICGDKMPHEPFADSMFALFDRGFSRKDFAAWFGLAFPPGSAAYGCRVELAVVEKYRVVESKDYVAAERTTRKLEKVK